MTAAVVVLTTSTSLPPGLLTAAAWDAVRSLPVFASSPEHPQAAALAEQGVTVSVPAGDDSAIARAVVDAAPSVWLAADGDAGVVQEITRLIAGTGGSVATLVGSIDPPGARLLDAVRVMDRLRSPGGCPWDAEQTHASLAKYLLEEAYETVELIESGEDAALVEEVGDVLLQVLFHARIASERDDGWDVDDVAAGLVDKLVRRHPHVFGDVNVAGAGEVIKNWDVIKAEEKGRTSVTEGVPLAQPALALAEKLLARAGRAGLPETLADDALVTVDPATALQRLLEAAPDAVTRDSDDAGGDAGAEAYVGRVLLLAVALARRVGVNPETALRASARAMRDRILSFEDGARGA